MDAFLYRDKQNKKSSYTNNQNIALKETIEFDVIKQNQLLKF